MPWLIKVQELLTELVYRNDELRLVTVMKDEYEHYDEALSRKPDYADAYLGRAHANFAMHRYDAAIRDYEEAARLEPNNRTARRYREIAQTHSEEGDSRG